MDLLCNDEWWSLRGGSSKYSQEIVGLLDCFYPPLVEEQTLQSNRFPNSSNVANSKNIQSIDKNGEAGRRSMNERIEIGAVKMRNGGLARSKNDRQKTRGDNSSDNGSDYDDEFDISSFKSKLEEKKAGSKLLFPKTSVSVNGSKKGIVRSKSKSRIRMVNSKRR